MEFDDDEKASAKRYVIVILRLLLDHRGNLVQGEVVSADANLHGRFMGWRGLNPALRTLLVRLRQQNTPNRE
jgi:hypothetical protein